MTAPTEAALTMLGTGFVALGLMSIIVTVANRKDPASRSIDAHVVVGALAMWGLMAATALVSIIGNNAWIACQ